MPTIHSDAAFATLQSRIHEAWARLLSLSLEDRLRYTASDCFETFPFPESDPRATIPGLQDVGKRLYEVRARFMLDTDQGLTKTYNALKAPTVNEPRVEELRHLHIEMDPAVLAAYAERTGDKTWLDIEVPPLHRPPNPRRKIPPPNLRRRNPRPPLRPQRTTRQPMRDPRINIA